jgi:hypothetical protein
MPLGMMSCAFVKGRLLDDNLLCLCVNVPHLSIVAWNMLLSQVIPVCPSAHFSDRQQLCPCLLKKWTRSLSVVVVHCEADLSDVMMLQLCS